MRSLRRSAPALPLLTSLLVACSEVETGALPGAPEGQQAVSLFGEALFQQEDTTGAIAEADAALAADPDNVDLIIAAGRVRRNVWQYRQAMELYTRAMELAPDDWRPYRFRGHRHISVRDFERAIQDLETARELAPLNWDVAYHLGLAYFLAGRFDDALTEYLRCLEAADDAEAAEAQAEDFRSCSQNRDDPESRVAMTEWAVRAAARAGRDEEVERLLAAIPLDLELEENVAYYHDLLHYKGEMTAQELLNPGPDAPYRRETVGFGVANWMLARGDTASALELLEELARDPWWPGFGRIAAEVELHRLTQGR
ncbi:MAG: tetratricopeptide repeat protein [Longimicrobiales bacterium]|nr:tetratricopeptide repeat protein [Longimicrobiales bacterium]